MEEFLQYMKPGERLDDLQCGGRYILQRPDMFRFGTDAVLLAHFCRLHPGDRVADLGSGTGILPLLLSARQPEATFDAIEIQPGSADILRRNVQMNKLEEQIAVHEWDLKEAPQRLGYSQHRAVISNPPYDRYAGQEATVHTIARHEVMCTLSDVLETAGKLLMNGGKLYMVYRAQRLTDLLEGMRRVGIEPKRICPVQPSPDKPTNLILVEGIRNGGRDILWLPTLCVRDESGQFSERMQRIYAGAYVDE